MYERDLIFPVENSLHFHALNENDVHFPSLLTMNGKIDKIVTRKIKEINRIEKNTEDVQVHE
jgi:uncharacterized protein YdcH (DUF465 family)